MGHVRLGTLPQTLAWKEVIRFIVDGEDVLKIAEAAHKAADKAFARMAGDKGFTEAVWLLTQLGIAAKSQNAAAHLESVGIRLSKHTSIAEVAVAIRAAVDQQMVKSGETSDIGNIASNALVSAVTTHLDRQLGGLFEAASVEVHAALCEIGKPKQFGELSRTFFAKLSSESLKYFLDKTIDTHIGQGQRFQTRSESRQFRNALSQHSDEAAKIVETFASDWFSKNRHSGGGEISRDRTQGFGWHAMQKIRDEMKIRAKA